MPPPVVLVHGFGSSFDHGWRATGWVDVLRDEGREPLGGDLAGHGAAGGPADPESYRGFEQAVLGWWPDDSTADAVGFSLGGQVVLRLAAECPDRFRRLVVLGVGDAVLRPPEDRERPDQMNDTVFERLIDATRNDASALRALLASRPRLLDPDLLRQVRHEVLVVIGSEDFTGPANELAASLPSARSVVVPGLDHFGLPGDQRAMEACLEFLSG